MKSSPFFLPASSTASLPNEFRVLRRQPAYQRHAPMRVAIPYSMLASRPTAHADIFAAGAPPPAKPRRKRVSMCCIGAAAETNPGVLEHGSKHNHQLNGKGEPSILADMTRHVICRIRRINAPGASGGAEIWRAAMAAIRSRHLSAVVCGGGRCIRAWQRARPDCRRLVGHEIGRVRPGAVSNAGADHCFHGDRDNRAPVMPARSSPPTPGRCARAKPARVGLTRTRA